MIPNSLKVRSVHFAYLFGPPRFVAREEASSVHGSVCDALSYDDLVFRYSTSEQETSSASKGFTILLQRKEGRGGLQVQVENQKPEEPVRLLLTHAWPASLQHAKEAFDVAAKAVFGSLRGSWTKVLAEARFRTECDVVGGDAQGFIISDLLGASAAWVEDLGKPLSFAHVELEVGASATSDSLKHPRRVLKLEVLREDRKRLYVELMSQWPQVQAGPTLDLTQIRPIDKNPSAYLDEAWAYLRERLQGLVALKGGAR